MALQKNDMIEIVFTGVTAQGAALGRQEGMAVFVPLGAPGDRALVRIVKVEKNFCYGRMEQVLEPAPCRVEPDCPYFAQCGGCCFRHISYEEELRLKQQRVADALERIGGFHSLPMEPILGAESRQGYRNKALLPLGRDKDGKLVMGFYAVNSHRIIDCQACRLHPPEFNTLMEAFRAWAEKSGETVYDEAAHKGTLRRLYLRKGANTGEVMACVVINGDRLRDEKSLVGALRAAVPELTTVVLNINRDRTNVALGRKLRTLYGPGYIQDSLCGLSFRISPLSFYQVNAAQAQRLYEKAAEFAALAPGNALLDLYCGAGTIGLSMASQAESLIGVEIIPQAVENARENARRNGVGNARFLCADASKAADQLAQEGACPQVIVLDPPRKGCSPALVRTVASMNSCRIVYVSCDPATLARDLKLFAELGYLPQKVAPVDMFPGTGHVETVVCLSQQKPDDVIRVGLDLDELEVTPAESKATYGEIKAYVLEKFGLKVSSLYISQVKRKCGLEVGENYNLAKSENARVPTCPPEKDRAIIAALEHFQMLEGGNHQ